MPTLDDTLPIRRSLLDRRIGQLVGIFQIDRKKLSDYAEARSLSQDGMVGLVAVADGGHLSETAFNVWTLCQQMFDEQSRPTTNRLDFTLSEYATRLWGKGGRSSTRRTRVKDAFAELMSTRVVVYGIDPYTFEPAEGAIWELHLLEAAGVRSHMAKIFADAKEGDTGSRTKALAAFAGLSSKAVGDDAKATWSLVLPKWLADSARSNNAVILDFDVQRALRGAAKRIWIQLESHGTWRAHRIPRPADEEELQAWVKPLTASNLQEILPLDDEDAVDVQSLVLPLDDDAYLAFGLCHANRKRDLNAVCVSILSHDRTYLRAEILPSAYHKRRFELHLVRARGAFRQERTRLSMKTRALGTGEDAVATT